MKDILLTILRDKETSAADFRYATEKLASLLAIEISTHLPKQKMSVETPLHREVDGYRFRRHVVLVPVLRSGAALLNPFMHYFPDAKVGFIGMRRDEVTAEPHTYYSNLPSFSSDDQVLILEPMIATGGSGVTVISMLLEKGVKQEQILFVGIIAAPEGLQRIQASYPKVRLQVVQVDDALNAAKFIVPGLGDFGDRYFGTLPEEVSESP